MSSQNATAAVAAAASAAEQYHPALSGANKNSLPARRAHAAFSAASESRVLTWLKRPLDLDPYLTFPENAARVVLRGLQWWAARREEQLQLQKELFSPLN